MKTQVPIIIVNMTSLFTDRIRSRDIQHFKTSWFRGVQVTCSKGRGNWAFIVLLAPGAERCSNNQTWKNSNDMWKGARNDEASKSHVLLSVHKKGKLKLFHLPCE